MSREVCAPRTFLTYIRNFLFYILTCHNRKPNNGSVPWSVPLTVTTTQHNSRISITWNAAISNSPVNFLPRYVKMSGVTLESRGITMQILSPLNWQRQAFCLISTCKSKLSAGICILTSEWTTLNSIIFLFRPWLPLLSTKMKPRTRQYQEDINILFQIHVVWKPFKVWEVHSDSCWLERSPNFTWGS